MDEPPPAERRRPCGRVSYAQNQEDVLLERLFQGRPGTYLDIGANHPYLDSNTYFFYLRGWRGVNLEPNPRVQALFQEYRPDDRTLAVAASDRDGTMTFFEVANAEGANGLSTVDREVAEAYRARGFEVNEVAVPVQTVASLITEHQIAPPDFVSIDVEGHEAAVIRSVPWSEWRPKVLVIEGTVPLSSEPSHREWEPILLEHGYLLAAFNGVNRFYLRDDLKSELHRFEVPVSAAEGYWRHDLLTAHNRVEEWKSRFEQEQAARAFDQANFNRIEAGWNLAVREYEDLKAAGIRERAAAAAERTAWDAERRDWARRLAAAEAERAAWEHRFADLADDRDRERASWQAQLTATQRQLRPYRLFDRIGLVRGSYNLARKLKHRLAS